MVCYVKEYMSHGAEMKRYDNIFLNSFNGKKFLSLYFLNSIVSMDFYTLSHPFIRIWLGNGYIIVLGCLYFKIGRKV